jgi:hypothetical protein
MGVTLPRIYEHSHINGEITWENIAHLALVYNLLYPPYLTSCFGTFYKFFLEDFSKEAKATEI